MNNIMKLINDNLQYYNLEAIYLKCIDAYNKEDVDLIFYDLYGLIYDVNGKIFEVKEKRDHQQTFREKIIDRYKKCIITDAPAIMCEAAHIKPFCECNNDEQYDIDNGILLRADIHKLFDLKLISINIDKIVLASEILTNQEYNFLWKYADKKITININSLKYLECHW